MYFTQIKQSYQSIKEMVIRFAQKTIARFQKTK